MKPGTFVRLKDGREGTVTYHGLDGYGIVFGRIAVDIDVILSGNADGAKTDEQRALIPRAMLRTSVSKTADARVWPGMECVGEDYEVIDDESHRP